MVNIDMSLKMIINYLLPPSPPPSPKTPPLPMAQRQPSCSVCEHHIADWMSLPLVQGESFYGKIRYKALKKESHSIAHLLYPIIMINNPSIRDMIENQFMIGIMSESRIATHSTKSMEYREFLKAVKLFHEQADVDVLIAHIEDRGCLKRETNVKEWLGYWMMALWSFLPNLHFEHQKKKECSYGGPAPGMRSFRSPQPPPIPPRIPCIPSSPPSNPTGPLSIVIPLEDLYA